MAKILACLSIVLLLTSCTKKTRENNVLHASLSGEISTLDPANSYDSISSTIVYQCYETLFEYHYLKRPYELKPLLAEDFPKIENNGLRYTIKIKKNIRYHDDPAFMGKPRYLKAQDFVTEIKRLAFLPTTSKGWWLFDQRVKGLNQWREDVGQDFQKFETLAVEGLQTPDDHTLVIELLGPFPQMIYALAMSFTSPVPIEVFRYYNNILIDKIVGTGPYVMKKWVRKSMVSLERFEFYRKDFYPGEGDRLANSRGLLKDAGKVIPFVDKAVYSVMTEANTRWLKFKAKQIDYLNLPKDSYEIAIDPDGTLKGDLLAKDIKLETFPTLTYWWLSFNMNHPILGKNKNLRMAIAHAIDIEKFLKDFTSNIGQRANSIYPPGIPGYDPTKEPPYSYNIEKAKMYLKMAGFPNGEGLPEFVFDTRGQSATNRNMAEFMMAQLQKIGLRLRISLNNFPSFLEKSRKGVLNIWLDGWVLDYPDAENIVQLLISKNFPPGPNATYYSSPDVDVLFQQLKNLENGEEKFEIMEKIEKAVHSDMPWVMLYYTRNYILYHNYLKNFRHSDIITNRLKYLKVENL